MKTMLLLVLALWAPALCADLIFEVDLFPPMFVLETDGTDTWYVWSDTQPYYGSKFGAHLLGQPETLTISVHSQDAVLTFQPLVFSGSTDFALVAPNFATGLPEWSFTEFDIVFTPASTGHKTASIAFQWSDGVTTEDFIINVSGDGVAAPVPVFRARGEGKATGSWDGITFDSELGWCGFWRKDVDDDPVTVYITNAGESGAPDLILGTPTLTVDQGDIGLDLTGFVTTLPQGATTSFTIHALSYGDKPESTIRLTHNDAYTGSPAFEIQASSTDYYVIFPPYVPGPVKSEKEHDSSCSAATGGALPLGLMVLPLLMFWRRRRRTVR